MMSPSDTHLKGTLTRASRTVTCSVWHYTQWYSGSHASDNQIFRNIQTTHELKHHNPKNKLESVFLFLDI